MSQLIVVKSLEPGIASVMLNRPQRCNALSIALLEQLHGGIQQLASDRQNRVVILRGEGPLFSAGLDLREAADETLLEPSAMAVRRVFQLLRDTPLILIAAVQGGALAGGAGLMAACDFVIASTEAKFAFPEARRGLLPALICDVLREKVREGDLRELFLAGESIDAARAQQVGLVQRIVHNNRVLEEAIDAARAVAAGGPETIRQTKALINNLFDTTGQAAGLDFIETHRAARRSAEAREGLAAFAEKREPRWQ